MKKEHVVIIALVVLLVIVVITWTITNQQKGKQWVNVGSWNEQQTEYNMTTPQFVITGEEWRVEWACNQIISGSHFDITIYDVYSGNVIKEISTTNMQGDTDFTGSGESYLNTKGRFYIKFFIRGNLGNWRISVSEYR